MLVLVTGAIGTVLTSTSVRTGAPGAPLSRQRYPSQAVLDGLLSMSRTRLVATLGSQVLTRGQQMSTFEGMRLKPISVAML